MCQLEQITWSCGHEQYIITGKPCESAYRLKTTPVTAAPDFCRSSIEVVKQITFSKACNAGCKKKPALDALARRHTEITQMLNKITQRARKVKQSLSSAQKPNYKALLAPLVEKGWDVKMLEQRCLDSFREFDRLLHEYGVVEQGVSNELGVELIKARAAIREYTVTTRTGKKKKLVVFDAVGLEQLGEEFEGQLRDLVREIERRASEACLEEMGWEMPSDDEEQCEVLRHLAGWKMGVASGSRMDDAYIGKEREIDECMDVAEDL